LKQALESPERHIIREVLESNNWNRNATADALGINRTTLYKKMKRLGLEDLALAMGTVAAVVVAKWPGILSPFDCTTSPLK